MPIKLRNKGRSPLTLELASLGEQTQTDVRFGRDPETGAEGRMELERKYPKSVFISGRGLSDELPDAARDDPTLAPLKGVVEVVQVGVAQPPTTKKPASPDASKES